MAKLSLAAKEDGNHGECPNCGVHITYRMSSYKGSYQNKLQWQNDDGSAHLKWVSDKNFKCNIPDEMKSDIPPNTPANPQQTIQEPPEATPLPRANPSNNNYIQELSGGFIQNIIMATNNIKQIEGIVRGELGRNPTTGQIDMVNDAKVGMYVKFIVDIFNVKGGQL